MAKSKTFEAEYKREGKMRMLVRKTKRNNRYKHWSSKAKEYGRPIHGVRSGGSWRDDSSPTGYTQICSYDVWGTCPSPCNGDC